MVEALRVWRPFLHGNPHVSVTDHRPLLSLSQSQPRTARQSRWIEQLQDGLPHWRMEYAAGDSPIMRPSDALSRSSAMNDTSELVARLWVPCDAYDGDLIAWPVGELRLSSNTAADGEFVTLISEPEPATLDILRRVRKGYETDPYYSEQGQALKDTRFSKRHDVWYFQERLCIPWDPALRRLLISECHDVPYAGHRKVDGTRALLERLYYWSNAWKSRHMLRLR